MLMAREQFLPHDSCHDTSLRQFVKYRKLPASENRKTVHPSWVKSFSTTNSLPTAVFVCASFAHPVTRKPTANITVNTDTPTRGANLRNRLFIVLLSLKSLRCRRAGYLNVRRHQSQPRLYSRAFSLSSGQVSIAHQFPFLSSASSWVHWRLS